MRIWLRDEGGILSRQPLYNCGRKWRRERGENARHEREEHECLVCYSQCGFFFQALAHAQLAD